MSRRHPTGWIMLLYLEFAMRGRSKIASPGNKSNAYLEQKRRLYIAPATMRKPDNLLQMSSTVFGSQNEKRWDV